MKTKLLLLTLLISFSISAQFSFNEIEIWPGSSNGSPRFITEFKGELYFSATNLSSSYKQLWKSDGTQAGSVLVKDLDGGAPLSFKVFNNELYFTAFKAATGRELWKTDGTSTGTIIVKDVIAGSNDGFETNANGNIDVFKAYNNKLYFLKSASTGRELWKTDGTEAGTVLVKNFNDGDSVTPQYLKKGERQILGVELNGELFFTIIRNGFDWELWKTDGTEAGTEIVKAGFEKIRELIVYNDVLYFAADDVTHGDELWKSDGTTSGTVLFQDIFPNNLDSTFGLGSTPDDLLLFNDELYFTARGYDTGNNEITGTELYKSDGTNAILIKDIKPGVLKSGLGNLPRFIEFNNELYFLASDDDSSSDFDLWKTDGTESGTVEVVSAVDTGNSFQMSGAVVFGNHIVYHNSQQLWVTDGTASGTKILTDNGDSNDPIVTYNTSETLNIFQNKVWFSGQNNSNGRELWSLNDSTLGIDYVIALNFSIYPNPATINFTIKTTNNTIHKIEIFNLLGRLVKTQKFTNRKEINVKTNQFSKGMYLVKVYSNGKTISKKLIIK